MRCILLAALCAGLLTPAALAQLDQRWAAFEAAPGMLPTGATVSDDDHETDLAWADLDLDGDVDLVVVRKRPFTTLEGRTNVLLMNEGGVLVDRTATLAADSDVVGDLGFLSATNDRDVVIADLDGDGFPEVVTATEQTVGLGKAVSHPRVYKNLGVGPEGWRGLRYEESRIPELLHFVSGLPFPPRFTAVAAGDIDGDGDVDLYFGDHDTGTALFGGVQPFTEDLEDRLLLNDGTGFFTDATTLTLSYAMVTSGFCNAVELVDINGDGATDIVKQITYQAPEVVTIAYNDPVQPGSSFDFVAYPSPSPYFLSTGDLDGNGRLDLAVTSNADDYVILNQGTLPSGHVDWSPFQGLELLFGAEEIGPFGASYGSNSLMVDLDADGLGELIIADVDVEFPFYESGFRTRLYHGRDTGAGFALTEERELAGPGGWVGAVGLSAEALRWTHDVAAFDVDRDGLRDLILSRREGTQVWRQIPASVCQVDLGFGAGLQLELCGGDLSSGTTAELQLTGGVPGAPFFLALGLAANPTPLPGFAVTLVPDPINQLLTLPSDATGSFFATLQGGGSTVVVAQAFQLDSATATLLASNALSVQKLP